MAIDRRITRSTKKEWGDNKWATHYAKLIREAKNEKNRLEMAGTLTTKIEVLIDKQIAEYSSHYEFHYKRGVETGEIKPK